MFGLASRASSYPLIVEGVDHAHATMYVDHPLSPGDAQQLRQLAQLLPLPVRVLRVQLCAADANEHTMSVLRDVIRAWRPRGNVHLIFVGGLPASRRQIPTPRQPVTIDLPAGLSDGEWSSAAHTAAFL